MKALCLNKRLTSCYTMLHYAVIVRCQKTSKPKMIKRSGLSKQIAYKTLCQKHITTEKQFD